MGSIVLKSLSVLLGLFFIFFGILKISCFLSKDLHRDLRKEFVKYAKVFPFSQLLGFKVPAKWYRKVIGCVEIVCGFTLVFIPVGRLTIFNDVSIFSIIPCYTALLLGNLENTVHPRAQKFWGLFFISAIVKRIVNVTLILLMALNVYSHYMVNDRFERLAPALVFFFMLVGRLVIEWQLKRQEEETNVELKSQKQD